MGKQLPVEVGKVSGALAGSKVASLGDVMREQRACAVFTLDAELGQRGITGDALDIRTSEAEGDFCTSPHDGLEVDVSVVLALDQVHRER